MGLDEDNIRKYVKYQKSEEKKSEAQQKSFEFSVDFTHITLIMNLFLIF